MCIRDRVIDEQTTTLMKYDEQDTVEPWKLVGQLDYHYPVSYTHLDVYKRQPLYYYSSEHR